MSIDPVGLFFFLLPALLLLAVSSLVAFSTSVRQRVALLLTRLLGAVRLSFDVENVAIIVRLLGYSGILIATVTMVIAIYQIAQLS